MATTEFKDKTVLVWDNGLFVHCAIKLSEYFGRVLYGTPSVNAFPKSNATLCGDGLDQIHRIIDIEDHIDEADLIVFPDVMFGALQERLVREGKRVWGARRGERLELDRWYAKQLFKKWNMPVGETHLITGIDALRRFLQSHDDYWIKTSRYRGDFETFRSKTYDHVKPRLDKLESDLGMKGEVYEFVVEKHIPAILELGYDGYTIDGQFPADDDIAFFGCEQKDLGYIGIAKPYGQFPEPLRWVNAKLTPYFKAIQYRGFFSSENRITDLEPMPEAKQFENCPMIQHEGESVPGTEFRVYHTDPCNRMASPPGELYMEWSDNWPEIMDKGADGIFVPIQSTGKYGVEVMIHSSWADKNWQPVMFPEEIRPYVKLRNHCRIKGVDSAVPQCYDLPEIGAVISIDDRLEEAVRQNMERCGQVEGYYIETKIEAIQKAITEIYEAQEQGIQFTDEAMPSADKIEEIHAGTV